MNTHFHNNSIYYIDIAEQNNMINSVFFIMVFAYCISLGCRYIPLSFKRCKEEFITETFGTYINHLDSELVEGTCSICLEPMETQLLKLDCCHCFHFKCIVDWFNEKNEQTCPICRSDIESKKSCC